MRHMATSTGTKLWALLVGLGAPLAMGAVTIETGQVEGTAQDGMTVYRGIPFAAPPVGDLRWQPPQPAAKWTGVKTTTEFAPACTGGGSPSGIRSQGAAKGKGPASAPAAAKAKAKQGGGPPG